MYSWEKKFGDVVNDTEKHLSKARHALDSARCRNGLTTYSEDSSSYHQSYPSDSHKHSQQPLASKYSVDVSYPYARQNDHSGGMVAILSEKIERQGKAIEDLTRQVLTLERDNEKGASSLRSLQQEVTSLRQRMSEDGVHLQTEEKVDRFQWEVKGKLEELKHQMEIQRRSDLESAVPASGKDWKEAITAELHQLKRQVERECNSLYREVEIVRAKLVRYDVDLSSQQGDTKDLSRQVDRLKEEVHTNSSKVSVQLNSISSATRASSRSKYTWLDKTASSISKEPVSKPSSPLGQNHRRWKKKTDDRYSSVKPPSITSAISGHRLSTSALSSCSSDDLSSDDFSNDDLSKPSQEKQDNSQKDTDNSLTMSDLELGGDSNHLDGSQLAFGGLSIDSDSLDLDI